MNLAKLKSAFLCRFPPPAVLALVIIVLYGNSWGGPFLVDDKVHILSETGVGNWSDLKMLWRVSFFAVPQAGIAQYYRPLTRFTYKIERLFFGEDSFGYHLFNTFLHFLNGWLVYLLGGRLLRDRGAALVAALFFVAHPLQVEEVTYISGLGGLAAATSMLASIYFYLRFQEEGAWILCFSALMFFLAGLFYKENALILPLLLFWLAGPAWRGNVSSPTRRFYLIGYVACLGGYIALRFSALMKNDLWGGGCSIAWLRFLSSGSGLLVYFKLILFPLHLHFYRSLEMVARSWNLAPLLVISAVAVIMAAMLSKKRPVPSGVLAGSGWLIIGLLPVCGLKPLFLQRGYLFWAEHFMYFPLVGVSLMVAGLACPRTLAGGGKPAALTTLRICGMVVLICYALLTLKQNGIWTDELRFARRAAKYEPHLFRTRELLGEAYLEKGEAGKAVSEYLIAKANLKRHSGCVSETDFGPFEKHYLRLFLSRLTCAYATLNRLPQAVKTSEEMIALFPGECEGYFLLGSVYLSGGNTQEALPYLKKAYQLNPRHSGAASSLIKCYQKLGGFSEAKQVWMEASRRIPAFREALRKLRER